MADGKVNLDMLQRAFVGASEDDREAALLALRDGSADLLDKLADAQGAHVLRWSDEDEEHCDERGVAWVTI